MAKSDSQRAWEYRERKKAKEAAAKVAAVDACGTRQQWYEKNRAELDQEKLKELQARHERTLDTLFWMENVDRSDPSDPDYVSLEDGIELLLEDIREHTCPHIGYITRDQEIPSDWSTGIWHDGRKYWHDSDLLQRLENEGPATALWVKYGLLSTPPDWMVVEFLTDHGWTWDKAAAVVGYSVPETGTRGTTGPVVYK
jgi:hypothetical protein